jgi:hypothetical protein
LEIISKLRANIILQKSHEIVAQVAQLPPEN